MAGPSVKNEHVYCVFYSKAQLVSNSKSLFCGPSIQQYNMNQRDAGEVNEEMERERERDTDSRQRERERAFPKRQV